MNPIRQWLDRRDARKQALAADLDARLVALVLGLEDRLSAKTYEFIMDGLGYAQYEQTIDVLWTGADAGELVLSPGERDELLAVTSHPMVDTRGLSAGKRHRRT